MVNIFKIWNGAIRYFLKRYQCQFQYLLTVSNPTLTGCNTGYKTWFAEQGKLPLRFTCRAGTSTCRATLLNKGELHCEDSAQNITCWAGQVRVLFCLPHCHFFAKFTCKRASVYVAHRLISSLTVSSSASGMTPSRLANTIWCQKPEKWLQPLYVGTHLRALSGTYPMNTNMRGFRCL